ncbi:MAG TPA: thiamine phosphate synthase [Nannocystis sp.]|jgi:hypothetical protein
MTPSFRLLAITPPQGPVPPAIVSTWLGDGPGLALLLREPGRSARELLAADGRLAAIRRACVAAGIPVLLSIGPEDLDLEIPPDIAGLHLRGDPDLPTLTRARATRTRPVPSDIRDPRVIASAAWLGRSCHGAPQPGDALVDYTLFAPVFAPTTAQPGRPLGSKTPAGLAALRAWTAAPKACVFALGGVGPATAAACLEAGAHGLAGIGVFFGEPGQVAQDVAALREIVAAFDRHVEPVSPR